MWDPMDFLERVVFGGADETFADGVAYHPYQHRLWPDRQPATADLGISRLGEVNDRIDSLCEPAARRCGGAFSAPADDPGVEGKRPGLYLTEFGYLNQPRATDGPPAWHTEWERRNWLYGSKGHDGALDLAERAGAKWMLLYQAVEDPPPAHDYGLFALAIPPEGQPNAPLVLGPDIHGMRPYGKNDDTPEDPRDVDKPARRWAYCGIRQWALEKGYFDPHAPDIDPTVPVTGQRPNRLSACKKPRDARNEAEYRAVEDE